MMRKTITSVCVASACAEAMFLQKPNKTENYVAKNKEDALPGEIVPGVDEDGEPLWTNTKKRNDLVRVGYEPNRNEERVDLSIEDTVTCEKDVPRSRRYMFAITMGCNRRWSAASKGESKNPLCASFTNGGCDSEECHEACKEWDRSERSCYCTHWKEQVPAVANVTNAQKFHTYSPGAPCSRSSAQPTCFNGVLYFSECFVKAKNADFEISADSMQAIAQTNWPKVEGKLYRDTFSLTAAEFGTVAETDFPCRTGP